MSEYVINPIGYFHTEKNERPDLPSQPDEMLKNSGKIVLNSGYNFEQALQGLEDFDRIWILFRFHRNAQWKTKVMPPRGGRKKGVLSTRSPHRPNFIGMSCVKLKKIKGLELYVESHDLLDGTPILDIKPYLNYADAHVSQRQGWLEGLDPQRPFQIAWSEEAQKHLSYLLGWKFSLKEPVQQRLAKNPFPYPNNRIKALGEDTYVLGYKSWRVIYQLDAAQNIIMVQKIFSGYDLESLSGKKGSRWGDLEVHRHFTRQFEL